MGPATYGDRSDAFWLRYKAVPGLTAGIYDCVVGVEETVGEVVLAKILPDVFLLVDFGAVGQQRQQADFVGHLQQASWLMPACAGDGDHGVCAKRDVSANLGEVQVYSACVDVGQHQGCADTARWADGAKEVGPSIATVTGCCWSRSPFSPKPGQRALLTHSCFIFT